MATVTGKTSDEIDNEIEQVIVGAELDPQGSLTFQRKNGQEIQAGSLGSSIVSAVINGAKHLIFTTMHGDDIDAGSVTPDLLAAWPVGSVYISVTSANPSTSLGGGTWVRLAQGKTLIGVDPSDADFDSVRETGGEKTHTLTEEELPSHRHTMASSGGHGHHVDVSAGTGGSSFYMPKGGTAPLTEDSVQSPIQTGGSNHVHTLNDTGSDAPHNNLPPYITVYIWERTA